MSSKQDDIALLEGNGVGFVRERNLAASIQAALERLYQLDRACDIHDFIEPAQDGERESVVVHENEAGELELSVRIPPLEAKEFSIARCRDLDRLCQLIEGVSHFVYIAERARASQQTTHLELELQAEVDKYVILAASVGALDIHKSAQLRRRLFEAVGYSHEADTVLGERYRVANSLAARYVRRLEREFVATKRFDDLRSELRRFFRMGQEAKMRASRRV